MTDLEERARARQADRIERDKLIAYSDAASRLWEVTKADWSVTVRLTLTEPVCAVVDLISDDDSLPSLRGFLGTYDANESIKLACEHHLRTLAATVTP